MKRILFLGLMCLLYIGVQGQDTLKVEVKPTDSDVAKRLYNEALELYNTNNKSLAAEMLNKSIEKDARFSESYLLLAKIQHENSNFLATEATLKKYMDNGGARALDTVYFLFAQMYSETSRTTDEISALNKCLQINDKYGEAYYTRGVANFESGKYEEALSDLTKAIDNGVHTSAAYNDRGSSNRMLGKFSDAVEDYSKAINIEGKAMYYCNRASVYAKMGRNEDAIVDYTQSIIVDRTYYKAYNGRGVVKANQEKYADAINDFTLCLDMAPDYTSALSNRGIAYYKIREYAKAVNDFDAAIKAEPHNGNTYMYRGNVKEMMRDKQGALDDWKKASSLGIKIADKYFNDNCN